MMRSNAKHGSVSRIYKMEALALQDVGICIESPDTLRVAARFSSEKKISKHMDNNKEMFFFVLQGL